MTSQEAMEKTVEIQTKANRAIHHHGLAVTAFNVAVARRDWALAEVEQQQALAHFSDYMDALMACQKIAAELEK